MEANKIYQASGYNLLHPIDGNPETNQHLAEIVASLKADGWEGRPVLVYGDEAYTGCHRLTACEILEITPETHEMEIERIPSVWNEEFCDADYRDRFITEEEAEVLQDLLGALLGGYGDDDDRLAAAEELLEKGFIDDYSVELMREEVDGNARRWRALSRS